MKAEDKRRKENEINRGKGKVGTKGRGEKKERKLDK